MLVLGSVVIFLLAVAGIGFFSLQALKYLGRAMNGHRPKPQRRASALLAAGAALAVVGSSCGGFFGITTLWWFAQAHNQAASPSGPAARP